MNENKQCKDKNLPVKSQITFIVAGKIIRTGELSTISSLKSIKEHFSDSKIILSTWCHEPYLECAPYCDMINTVDYDDYNIKFSSLLSEYRGNTGHIQQLLVHSALKKVTTLWVVKTRTDFVLKNDVFFHFYCKWDLVMSYYRDEYRIFKRRVLAPWLFTKNPDTTSAAYQLSDFFQFGLKEDIGILWDGHKDSDRMLNYFTENPNTTFSNPENYDHLFNIEQAFFMNALSKQNIVVSLPEWYCDPSVSDYIEEIHLVYSSNIILSTLFELGIKTRWEEEEPIFPEGMFISFQQLITWYLSNLESSNYECAQYLRKNPKPRVAKWTLRRKVRMMLREIKILRLLYRILKNKLLIHHIFLIGGV